MRLCSSGDYPHTYIATRQHDISPTKDLIKAAVQEVSSHYDENSGDSITISRSTGKELSDFMSKCGLHVTLSFRRLWRSFIVAKNCYIRKPYPIPCFSHVL